ncbi:MAG: helix-turn-helix transcriptional regulator [Candidatus Methanomethylophilaceae archaeon]|nr:helix-turn-helix transcriptional regulator [Candidatus Methanomethylophilaceae archaeon]
MGDMEKGLSFEEFIERAQKETEITEDCEMYRAMQTINGRWRMVVMYQLSKKDSFRFGELQKSLPNITKSMLSAALKELEGNGLVSRVQYNEIPPHVEYSLTDKGRGLFPIFYEIYRWLSEYPPSPREKKGAHIDD